MSTATTSKRINVRQLDTELGNIGIVCRGADPASTGEKTIEAPVSQAALAAAIAGHAAVDTDANASTLRQRAQAALAANATFVGATKPNTASAQASAAYDQTVRLTRECSALIKLVLGLLDDTTGT